MRKTVAVAVATLFSALLLGANTAYRLPKPRVDAAVFVACRSWNVKNATFTWSRGLGTRESLLHVIIKNELPRRFLSSFLAPAPHFWLHVRSGRCADALPITIVPYQAKGVSLLLHTPFVPGFEQDALHWIAGTIPRYVVGVQLRDARNGDIVDTGMLQNRSYYFELLPAGSYVLAFQIGPGRFLFRKVSVPAEAADAGIYINLDKNAIMTR